MIIKKITKDFSENYQEILEENGLVSIISSEWIEDREELELTYEEFNEYEKIYVKIGDKLILADTSYKNEELILDEVTLCFDSDDEYYLISEYFSVDESRISDYWLKIY